MPKSSFGACANLNKFSAIRRSRPTQYSYVSVDFFAEDGFHRRLGVSATIPTFVSDAKQTRRFFVSGIVQGVGYRFFAQRAAEKLGVCGYARNLYDGRVEVLAVGSAEQLEVMKRELERGPRFSNVSGVREEQAQREPPHENGFAIAPDA